MLNKDHSKRLGAVKGAKELIEHEYFKDINWSDVYNRYKLKINNLRKLKPPKPKIKNELLEKFTEPKEFENLEHHKNNYSKHFNNWSFVNTDNTLK